jgi:hypothetical protein
MKMQAKIQIRGRFRRVATSSVERDVANQVSIVETCRRRAGGIWRESASFDLVPERRSAVHSPGRRLEFDALKVSASTLEGVVL